MEKILDWNVEEASAVDGDGMVMFIKLGAPIRFGLF
jgi:hypothetical protein